FSLLNLAVIIMRESRIDGYDPGYRSPLYPWMQIAGFVAPLWLISEMGQMAILFTAGLVLLTLVWYFKYAHPRVERSGAIFHTFARWGTLRYEGLDRELRSIVREKGLRVDDSFDQVIARAPVMEIPDPVELTELAAMGAKLLEEQTGVPAAVLEGGFRAEVEAGFLPVARGVALPHIRVEGIPHPFILMARCHGGVRLSLPGQEPLAQRLRDVRAVFFLVSPEEEPGMHLRLLGHLAQQVDDPAFLDRWGAARDQAHLKETLLQDDQWIHVDVGQGAGLSPWAGREVRELQLPAGVLVALIRRDGLGFVPHGSTVLQDGDHLTVIGEPRALRQLESRREAPLPL
ncbi:MAG TPA: TrkA C-terminal domain-containing protein, partial [Longimicrobiales bacterium]|nr:TrkA C-terminal domain-containing protein [Longimicrobiales bacterium]